MLNHCDFACHLNKVSIRLKYWVKGQLKYRMHLHQGVTCTSAISDGWLQPNECYPPFHFQAMWEFNGQQCPMQTSLLGSELVGSPDSGLLQLTVAFVILNGMWKEIVSLMIASYYRVQTVQTHVEANNLYTYINYTHHIGNRGAAFFNVHFSRYGRLSCSLHFILLYLSKIY